MAGMASACSVDAADWVAHELPACTAMSSPVLAPSLCRSPSPAPARGPPIVVEADLLDAPAQDTLRLVSGQPHAQAAAVADGDFVRGCMHHAGRLGEG